MHATRLRTEYLAEPLGLGIAAPRLFWTCAGGVRQTAYRIIATRDGRTVWDTGRVESSRMTHVRYQGAPLGSRDRVEWTVQLWDEDGEPGEPSASWFELGLLQPSDWTAHWITGDYRPKRNTRYPVDCFRRSFRSAAPVRRARLYVTACGLYEARLNGHRVGEFQLAPGSTDYRKRLQYQTYDVTDLLGDDNDLELWLADGWYRGSVGNFGQTNVFGRQTALLVQLEIDYADGSRQVIASDDGFAWSDDGPIRFADLKDGEVVDARLTPTYRGRARLAEPGPVLTASDNVQPAEHEVFTPTLLTTPSGQRVLDFGQNIAGFVSFTVTGERGQQLRLRLGEILDSDGEFTQANIAQLKPVREFGSVTGALLMTRKERLIPGKLQQTPQQEIVFTCSGGEDHYRTRFAVFGFRYALVDTELVVDLADFRAIAVYSAVEPAGEFECSSPGVNRFLENTRWSMKGNFLDVPTDCPTRERLAWTGDAQVFFLTATYLADVASFFRKWIRDLADAQLPSGKVSAIVPYSGLPMLYDTTGGSVGWCDALVLVPYRFWKQYGDRALLEEAYPMMRRYGEFMIGHTGHKSRRAAKTNPYDTYVYEKGFHLGEWLEPEEFRDDPSGAAQSQEGTQGAAHTKLRTEEATAYLHYTMTLLAEAATQLGEDADAARFTEYADGAAKAYTHLFAPGGTIDTDRQAKLVRPLALGLLDGDARRNVQQRLVRAVETRQYRVGTGFLSTALVLGQLTEAGRPDVAYRMLENEQAPGWLAQVKAGATTVWEDWEGKVSHNHYANGAVCQWLFDTVLGIRVAGENRFVVAPVPGGTLSYARGSHASLYGTVTSHWERTVAGYRLTVTIPPNTAAELRLPGGEQHEVGPGTHEYEVLP